MNEQQKMVEVLPIAQQVTVAGKEYKMRFFSIADQQYFDTKYTREKFFDMVQGKNSSILLEIAHRLMAVDEDGNDTAFKNLYPSATRLGSSIPQLTAEARKLEIAVLTTMFGDVFTQTLREVMAAQSGETFQRDPNAVARVGFSFKSLLRFVGLGHKKT